MSTYTRANEIVRIRAFENGDATSFVAAARESVETVGKWMDWCHADYSIEDARTWIESCQQNSAASTTYEFALVDPITGEFFGGAGVNQINTAHNFANIGYWVRQSRQGCGIATAAARLLIEFAFTELKLTRVELVIRPDNLPSRHVAEKVGATLESIARNRIISYGKAWVGAIYSVVPDSKP
jgi:ribosomal-protein-serine acetyltransferase